MHFLKYMMIILLGYVCTPWMVFASPLSADIAFARLTDRQNLALRNIEIDSSFKGMKMLLFGARNEAGDIVVVVRGPELSYIVRKKERVAGIWVNKKQVEYKDVSGFYAISASRSLNELGNDYLLSSLGIDLSSIAWAEPQFTGEQVQGEFLQALLTKEHEQNLYMSRISDVNFIGDTLFRTIINFPENIPRGTYTAEVYLFRDGKLMGMQSIPLLVKKKGFDAVVFDLAYQWPMVYGLVSVLCALLAGWGAGVIFKRI